MPFFEPVWYNRVLVNWPRAHSGVLQLTEASYLGPDSPRTSPRNETVKQCRLQMTVANSPVRWPSWTWCRIWWNHSWDSSRVTLNQRCFVFIRPCTHQVYRYYVISQTQSHSAVFGCSPIGVDGVVLTAGPCLTVVTVYRGIVAPIGGCMTHSSGNNKLTSTQDGDQHNSVF